MPPSRPANARLTQAAHALADARRRGYNWAMTRFGVLGPFEVTGDGGVPVAITAAKHRAVLAVLLLRAGKFVSDDQLIDTVWGEDPPKAARAALQNAIHALRRQLGAELVSREGVGYVLNLNSHSFDLLEFEQLVHAAAAKVHEERAALLRQALDLWRGEPLAGLRLDGLAPEVRHLEELRLLTEEHWFEAELEADRAAQLVPRLEFLVPASPERESLRRLLMLALYRSGRQADALAAYQDARRWAIEQLGQEPSAELQELNRAMIRQDPRVVRPSTREPTQAEHLEEVAKVLLSGKLVPVLGGDVDRLAEALAQRFELPPGERAELTRVAQYVALTRGEGPLYEELREMLAETRVTDVHRFFARLPAFLRQQELPHQLLVTTSYDLALEQAFLDEGEQFDVVSYLNSGRDRGRFCHLRPDGSTHVIDVPNTYAVELSLEARTVILKLHGGVAADALLQESFVVTEDDYIDYLGQTDVAGAIPVALSAKLRRSHFLFLGFGMREWSLRLVLARMWGTERALFRSWAVSEEARPLEDKFWRVRDVDSLEAPLDDYVSGLARYLGLPAEVAT
jgi:DNA-binding SARP family transcriptional activator